MAEDYDIAAAVRRIEDEVIASMICNLDHHRAEEDKEGINWEQWRVKQLAALEDYKKRNAEKYGNIFNDIDARFFLANDRKINALIQATKADLQKAEYAIQRMANDQYRKVIFDAQMYAASGAGTYESAVDMAIRTAGKWAYLTGEGESRRERGITTVMVPIR